MAGSEYQSRIARKRWECAGDGALAHPAHAEGCEGHIEPGELCIEMLDSTPAYSSGPRICLACAEAFHDIDIELVKASRAPTCRSCGGVLIDAAGRCESCGAVQPDPKEHS